MADLICASALTDAPALIDEFGGDARELFGRVGIDVEAAGAHDRFVPFSSVAALLGLCASRLEVPDFALRLAARQHPDILGPVAIAARNAETVGAALQRVTEFAHVYSPAIETTVQVEATELTYEVRTVLQRLPARDHVVELAVGVTWSTFVMLGGPDLRPTRVSLMHPPIAAPEAYTAHFGCPVEFRADRNLLVFPAGLVHRRPPQVDPLAHDLALRFMAGQERDETLVDVVAEIVVRSLPSGAATLEQVARLLAMHPRTVQRRLAETSTSFEEILDGVRRDLAVDLLTRPAVPMSAIAAQLGYSSPSTLTRSSRRWFGLTPQAKRRELCAR